MPLQGDLSAFFILKTGLTGAGIAGLVIATVKGKHRQTNDWENHGRERAATFERNYYSCLILILMLCFGAGAVDCYCAQQWPEGLFDQVWYPKGLEDQSFALEGCGVLKKCVFNPEKEEVTLLVETLEIGSVNLVYPESQALSCYRQWHIGQRIAFQGTFSTYSRARNPGAFDYQSFQFAQGIVGQVAVIKEELTALDQGSRFFTTLQNIRVAIIQRLASLAEEEDAGILICILTGDKRLLSQEWKDLYQDGGILHLLAISGLHISVLGILLYQLLRKTVGDYFISCMTSATVVACFCLMVGTGSSVVRAGICFLLYLGAELTGRQYDLATAVSLAGLLLLWEHPLMLFQSGFLMTFSCMFGIAFILPVTGWMLEMPDQVQPFVQACFMQLSSLIVVLWFQGKAPVLGALVNMITVPLMVYVLLSDLLALALGGLSEILGIMSLGPAHYILNWYELVCRKIGMLPHAQLVTGRPRGWQILVMIGLLIGLYAWGRYLSCWKDHRIHYVWALMLLPCALLVLGRSPEHGMQMTFLDVGQGDGIIMELPEHKGVFCVDGGSSSNKKLMEYVYQPYLDYAGIGEVDYWLVTHPDGDHYSGLLALLQNGYQVKHLLMPEIFRGSELAKELEAYGKVDYIKAGDGWNCKLGSDSVVKIQVLHPSEDYYTLDTNDGSAVLLVSIGDYSILLTGDLEGKGEQQVLEEMQGKKVNLLKLGHHGSKNSSSMAFLQALRPETVVISAGKNNRYGHPHAETLERVEEIGAKVYRTDQLGAVTLAVEDGAAQITGYLE